MTDWVEETLHEDLHIRLKADRVLHDNQTEHQRLVIFENATFGRCMSLDGVTQTTVSDEFIYHEMLAHLPILAHGSVRRVLIIGGGDGGMLEEVLKHRSVETATMVDIDDTVIELSKQHLRAICGEAFEDPRAKVVIADGKVFLREAQERYDVIIVDSTDPIGPGEALFTRAFYQDCKRCLNEGGILVTQNGVPFLQGPELRSTMAIFKTIFADTTCYLATVPTYVGGPMAFGWGCDDTTLREVPVETLRDRFEAAGLTTRYYTPEVHKAAFALPGYIAELVG